jgi:DNA-binding transcriptional ArsR family regulator
MEATVRLFRTLANHRRLRLLRLLVVLKECRVSQLIDATGVSAGAVSNDLRALSVCGVVWRRRSGRAVYYRLAEEPSTPSLKLSSPTSRAHSNASTSATHASWPHATRLRRRNTPTRPYSPASRRSRIRADCKSFAACRSTARWIEPLWPANSTCPPQRPSGMWRNSRHAVSSRDEEMTRQ